jgi:hypothetical protein
LWWLRITHPWIENKKQLIFWAGNSFWRGRLSIVDFLVWAAFYFENISHLFCKTSYPLKPSPQVSVTCSEILPATLNFNCAINPWCKIDVSIEHSGRIAVKSPLVSYPRKLGRILPFPKRKSLFLFQVQRHWEETSWNVACLDWCKKQGILKEKYHCTIDLLFDWFEISSMTTDNFGFYLQNRLIQTSQTGGQRYSDKWKKHIF